MEKAGTGIRLGGWQPRLPASLSSSSRGSCSSSPDTAQRLDELSVGGERDIDPGGDRRVDDRDRHRSFRGDHDILAILDRRDAVDALDDLLRGTPRLREKVEGLHAITKEKIRAVLPASRSTARSRTAPFWPGCPIRSRRCSTTPTWR